MQGPGRHSHASECLVVRELHSSKPLNSTLRIPRLAGDVAGCSQKCKPSDLGYLSLTGSICSLVAGMATTTKLFSQPRDGLVGKPARIDGSSGPDLLLKKLEDLSLSQRVAKML